MIIIKRPYRSVRVNHDKTEKMQIVIPPKKRGRPKSGTIHAKLPCSSRGPSWTVTLPHEWTDEHGIGRGDKVVVEALEDGSLKLSKRPNGDQNGCSQSRADAPIGCR